MNAAQERLQAWRRDPVRFVRECLLTEPDAWQADVLRVFPRCPRLAMKACKGPGKTTVLAWLVWNFLLTRPHPRIACTSVTADNLGDCLWTEIAKWQKRSPLLSEMFEWQRTRVFAREHPETWWAAARAWPKTGSTGDQNETLAGLHGDYLLFILDECGSIPDGVMAAAEAGLANARGGGGVEAHLVIAGNPTMLSGPLYRASTTERDLWHVVEITADPDDPKRSPRVSVEWAREQIKKYGRDNPYVLVNVFGQFPPVSINALLGPNDVSTAMGRRPHEHEFSFAPRILGVDIAREGDDRSVIFPRQGLLARTPLILRNATSLHGAGVVSQTWRDHDADACFVDGTGGFGAGWIDQLRLLGFAPVEVQFAGRADDPRFANKRAEMWWRMAEWVKGGGTLPNVPELVAELTEPTYTFRGDQLLLEPKDDVKERLGRSPDLADALALTFSFQVQARQKPPPYVAPDGGRGDGNALRDYNPFTKRRGEGPRPSGVMRRSR